MKFPHLNPHPAALLALGLTLAAGQASDLAKSSAPIPAPPVRTTNPSHPAAVEPDTTYLRDVLPILMGRCARCHNDGSLLPNWLDYKTAYHEREEMKRRVWDSWRGAYYKQAMPAGDGQECQGMTEQERATIKHWVAEGAAYGVLPSGHQPRSPQERIQLGQKLFANICSACHQPNAQGIPDKFPPLAASDFLNADKSRAIKVLINGRQGQIVVNHRTFNNSMPSFPLGDEDIANALTFVYNSFGNSGKVVTPDEVHALRGQPDANAPGQQTVASHAPEEKSPFE